MTEIISNADSYEWSISKMSDAFGFSRKTISDRLRRKQIQPTKKVNRYPVYLLKDAMKVVYENEYIQSGDVDPDLLSPTDRKAWYQSEHERIKLEKEIGNLCDSEDVRREFASMVKAVVQILETMPNILERDCGLTPKQSAMVQSRIDDLREEMARRVAKDDEDEESI